MLLQPLSKPYLTFLLIHVGPVLLARLLMMVLKKRKSVHTSLPLSLSLYLTH